MSLAAVKVQAWKREEVEELKQLINSHKVIGFSSLHKVRTAQIQELRKIFRGEVKFRCAKNNLMRLALKENSDVKAGVDKLEEYLDDPSLYIFTDLNPFKLSIMFSKNKIKLPAKAGDIAPEDIIIPEGNTGIPPGPILSEFSEMKLPTKLESGSIWISTDTLVAKKGEAISDKLASILSRLGIKPMEAELSLKVAYEDGLIHTADVLAVDLEGLRQKLQEAASSAYNLTVNAYYPTSENIPILLAKAATEARNLAAASSLFEKEVLPMLLGKCYGEMVALKNKLVEKDPTLAQ